MRGTLFILLLISLFSAQVVISGTLLNSKPAIENITMTDQDGSVPGSQINTPPPVTVEVNATAVDLNGYADLDPANSSCTWKSGTYSVVTSVTFSNCHNVSCKASCHKIFNVSEDPSGVYTVTLRIADQVEAATVNLTLEHNPVKAAPEEAEKSEPMKVSTTFICPGNLLKVIVKNSNSKPLDDVRVYLWKGQYIKIGEQQTDKDGIAYLSISETGTYLLLAHKSGYRSFEGSFYLSPCPQVPQPLPAPECLVDSDCADDELCENESCVNIRGICGYAANHEWMNYECCADSDCIPLQKCFNNACVNKTYDLIVPAESNLGRNITIKAIVDSKNFSNATIRVQAPDGSEFTIITDGDGNAVLQVSFRGFYTFSLLDGGTVVKTAMLQSRMTPAPPVAPEVPAFVETPCLWPWALLILLLLGLAYYLWKRRKRRKK